MPSQPGFGRGIDQRLDAPGLGIDLLGGLQRVAAVDEDRGLVGEHDGKARRSGEAGQPGQPLLGRRDIFVLLLIGAGNDETAQFPAQQFLAKGGQPRRQRNAAFGLLEGLEMGFEHGLGTLGRREQRRNATRSARWHNICLKISAC